MRDFSHHELRSLAALCSGGAVLIAVAVFFSAGVMPIVAPQALSAATLLGNTQGIGPAPSICNVDQTGGGMCANGNSRSLIFSIHLTDSVQTTANTCPSWRHYLGGCGTTTTATGQTLTEQCNPGGGGCVAGSSAGTPVTVESGKSITLEFDELTAQNVGYPNGCSFFCGDRHTHITYGFLGQCKTTYGADSATLPSYDGGYHKQSSVTLTPTASQTYAITCSNFTLSISVTVVDHINPPTLNILGNGVNPVTVKPGQQVTIAGTYSAAAGDTLTKTVLNDSNNNLLPGISATPPGNKQYAFSTTSVGTYTFYPAATTMSYTSWNNYGKSLVVTVSCPSGQEWKNNKCRDVVTTCVAGSHKTNPPTCDKCDDGYLMQGNQCVVGVCPGAHQIGYPTCKCDVGYSPNDSGVCTLQPPSISSPLKATPTRVIKGHQTTLSWATTGMAADACTLHDNLSHVLSQTPSSSGLPVTVGAQTVFTLTCLTSGPTLTSSVTVTIDPSFQEI